MSNRLASYLLGACSLLAIAAISMHPVIRARKPADVLHDAVAIGPMDRAVHAAVIIIVLVMLFALVTYTAGRLRAATVAALIPYGAGAGALVCAGLIDGYFVPAFAQASVGTPAAMQSGAIAVLVGAAVAIQIATKFALIAMSVATLIWSIDLVTEPAYLSRVAGASGVIAGIVVFVLTVTTHRFNPHSLMAVVVVQALWYLAIARLLYVREAQS